VGVSAAGHVRSACRTNNKQEFVGKVGFSEKFEASCFDVSGTKAVGTAAFPAVLEEPNEKTSKAIEDAKKKKDVLGPFDNSDDLMKALKAKDSKAA
jgi:hypothetical protein